MPLPLVTFEARITVLPVHGFKGTFWADVMYWCGDDASVPHAALEWSPEAAALVPPPCLSQLPGGSPCTPPGHSWQPLPCLLPSQGFSQHMPSPARSKGRLKIVQITQSYNPLHKDLLLRKPIRPRPFLPSLFLCSIIVVLRAPWLANVHCSKKLDVLCLGLAG